MPESKEPNLRFIPQATDLTGDHLSAPEMAGLGFANDKIREVYPSWRGPDEPGVLDVYREAANEYASPPAAEAVAIILIAVVFGALWLFGCLPHG